MHTLSLHELATALKNGQFSSVELTTHFLQRIEQAQSLNAFIHIDEEQALLAAKHADKLIKTGHHTRLTGIPLAHKDIFCTKTMPTTCASKMLGQFHPPYDATIVKRLHSHGTVLLGKTNMDEFAMGSSNETSFFGPVKNPWDTSLVPGGSSGGSAACVAAQLVPFATGSDTGGSIRQPAAFCGISGIKPTYGLISRFGMIAFASSFDQAGPMAKSAEDLAYVLQVCAGHDESDSTSTQTPIPDYVAALSGPLKPLRIGVSNYWFDNHVDSDIKNAILAAIDLFKKQGAEIIDIDLSLEPLWSACYYVLACAEASSNLSRYDGVRYGYRTAKADSIRELITLSRSESFGMEVQRRILTGTYVLSAGYFEAYYVHAQKIRRMIQNELLQCFSKVDVILSPTTPTCAFKLNEKHSNPTQAYLADCFTVGANLGGFPAISIPAGFSQGLPIGMQLMGTHFSEARLLNVAHQYQQLTDWHKRTPISLGDQK